MKFATFNYIREIELTDEVVSMCSHQGQCDEDVKECMELPEVKAQLNSIDKAQLVKELSEYGAWSDQELSDHQDNLMRILWIAAGNILDGDFHEAD